MSTKERPHDAGTDAPFAQAEIHDTLTATPGDASGVHDTVAATPGGTSGIEDTVCAPPARPSRPSFARVDPQTYVRGDEIARGGMGRVIAARDRRLDRPVAIKELLHLGADAVGRFEREALISAQLQHPSILTIYEAGRWPGGEPFYAMKHVVGESLDKLVARTQTLDQRLALIPALLAVFDALAYAHDKSIIHRDLKPANVLVGEFGETVVIDWGLAKHVRDATEAEILAPRNDDSTSDQTVVGSVMGTPSYMPPEQARGDAVDTRADVYSLGAMLYYVLAGSAPHTGNTVEQILQAVRTSSARAIREVVKDVPPDLATIVDKAMAHEPADRYPTAKELADDLRRFQTGQLVGAHSYSMRALVKRWVRRHRTAVSIGAAAVIVLAIAGVVAIRSIIDERERADRERAEAVRARGAAEERGEAARAAESHSLRRSDDLTLLQARTLIVTDPTKAAAYLKTVSREFTRWGELRLIAMAARQEGIARHVLRFDDHVNAVAIDRAGARAILIARDGNARIVELASGSTRALSGARHAAWLPDGRLAVTGATADVSVYVGERRVATHGGPSGKPVALLASPDGDALLELDDAGHAWLWDARTLGSRVLPDTPAIAELVQVKFSPDGRYAAASSADGVVRVWSTAPDAPVHVIGGFPGRPFALAFTRDGTRLIVGGAKSFSARVIDPATGRTIRDLVGSGNVGLDGGLQRATVSPDDRFAVVPGVDRRVRIWELATGKPSEFAVRAQVLGIEYIDRERVLMCSDDGTCAIHVVATGAEQVLFKGHEGAIFGMAISPDRRTFVTGSRDQTARVWPFPERVPYVVDGEINYAPLSPDGKRVAVSTSREARVIDLGGGPALHWPGRCEAAAWSANSEIAAFARVDGKITLRRVRDGSEAYRELDAKHETWSLAFSPDGKTLASGSHDRVIRIWNLQTGEHRALRGHTDIVGRLSWFADGRLASSSLDGTVRIWDVATATSRVLDPPGPMLFGLALSPDQKSIVTTGSDSAIRFWDANTLQAGRVLTGHRGVVFTIGFSPDGKMLASGAGDHTFRLWDLESSASQTVGRYDKNVGEARFSGDGTRVVAAGHDLVAVYDLVTPTDIAAWIGTLTTARIEKDTLVVP